MGLFTIFLTKGYTIIGKIYSNNQTDNGAHEMFETFCYHFRFHRFCSKQHIDFNLPLLEILRKSCRLEYLKMLDQNFERQCKLSSIYVFSYFPFGFEGRIWDLIVSVPDYCLSFYFLYCKNRGPSDGLGNKASI